MRKHYFVEKKDKGYLIERKKIDGQTVDKVELEMYMNNENPTPSPSPGPDTVGTEEIIDGSILKEDLNKEVTDSLFTEDKRVKEEELDNFEV